MEWFFALIVVISFVFASIRIISEYERGVRFRLGRYHNILGPGLNFVLPVIDSVRVIDTRVRTMDIPSQEAITKDNVSVKVDGLVYYKVVDPKKSVLEVVNYDYAVVQYAQTALRDVIGKMALDDVLAQRDQIANEIRAVVDKFSDAWGIDIIDVKMQNIELPTEMKRAMARQAEAEREKRATVIKSTGEVEASKNLADAAKTMGQTPGALHLRTLETINDVSADQSNTIVFALPIEVLDAIRGFANKPKK